MKICTLFLTLYESTALSQIRLCCIIFHTSCCLYYGSSVSCLNIVQSINPQKATNQPTRLLLNTSMDQETDVMEILAPAPFSSRRCRFICTGLISQNAFCSFCFLLLQTEMRNIRVTGRKMHPPLCHCFLTKYSEHPWLSLSESPGA